MAGDRTALFAAEKTLVMAEILYFKKCSRGAAPTHVEAARLGTIRATANVAIPLQDPAVFFAELHGSGRVWEARRQFLPAGRLPSAAILHVYKEVRFSRHFYPVVFPGTS